MTRNANGGDDKSQIVAGITCSSHNHTNFDNWRHDSDHAVDVTHQYDSQILVLDASI